MLILVRKGSVLGTKRTVSVECCIITFVNCLVAVTRILKLMNSNIVIFIAQSDYDYGKNVLFYGNVYGIGLGLHTFLPSLHTLLPYLIGARLWP